MCLFAGAACSAKAGPPEPGSFLGVAPDLTDQRVMVLPFQRVAAVGGDADAELAFGLRERGGLVSWVLPEEIDAVLQRSPGMDARTRGLPVDQFLVAEVRRVGDPLYGYLRRMAALVNADVALLPVLAAGVAGADGGTAVRVHAALIDVRSGRVLWFSVEEGGAFPSGDPRGLASAMDAVAGALVR